MAAVLPALAAGLVACGGSTERPVAGEATVSTTSTRGAQRSREQGCAARGITVPPFNEGACVQDGRRFVVANGRSVMRLRSLSVAIRRFSVIEALGRGGKQPTPQGVFLVISLDVTNRTGRPQRFAPGQTLLTLEEQRFEEHKVAETRFLPDALAFSGRSIPPGKVASGTVVYDVPPVEIDRITSEGELLVVNFGGGQNETGLFRIGMG